MEDTSSYMIGQVVGMFFAPVILAWITSLITRVIGKIANKPEWHGWHAGLVVACLGVLGQVVQMNVMGVGASSLGTLIVWHQAREKSKGA